METIKFYSTRGPYGSFSNFYKAEVYYNYILWRTSEHAYQAAKFTDEEIKLSIARAKSPFDAVAIGRDPRNAEHMRPDWEDVKYDVMKEIVGAKFSQHGRLQDILVATGDALIIEDAPGDYVWGVGKDGTGTNWLGKVLMEVREDFTTLL